LLGIALSTHAVENCGNFSVAAGAHKKVAAYLQQNNLTKEEEIIAKGVDCQKFTTPASESLYLQKGDVVFCHHHLPTNIAPNVTPNIGYMVYFKLYSTSRPVGSFNAAALTSTWSEYDHLRTSIM